jgi:ribosomal-protein-alanine N-acetyltransferase
LNRVTTQLDTERLILRPPTLEDADALTSAIDHPDIAHNTLRIPYPYTLEDAHEFLDAINSGDDDAERSFAVKLRETGTLIGMCGFSPPGWGRTEIGYWISSAHWGKGYATEAARRVIGYIFETTDVSRVQATYFTRNPASRRVQEKAGMTFEGVMRAYFTKNGEPLDVGMCAVLRSEWEGGR